MKKFDLVKLVNNTPYEKQNLKKGMYGVVLDENFNGISVLFFNQQNVGSFVIACVANNDIQLQKEKLPDEIQKEILLNLDYILSKAKNILEPVQIKEYDMVELLVENPKYSQFGIHKGDKGCAMDAVAVDDHIEVDFSGIDKNGHYYGDCVSVKIGDLKVINK